MIICYILQVTMYHNFVKQHSYINGGCSAGDGGDAGADLRKHSFAQGGVRLCEAAAPWYEEEIEDRASGDI